MWLGGGEVPEEEGRIVAYVSEASGPAALYEEIRRATH